MDCVFKSKTVINGKFKVGRLNQKKKLQNLLG